MCGVWQLLAGNRASLSMMDLERQLNGMLNSNDLDPANFARKIRAHALRMVYRAKASHIGSCLSMADILAVLYTRVLHIDPLAPNDPNRDRFILSKGHAAAIL